MKEVQVLLLDRDMLLQMLLDFWTEYYADKANTRELLQKTPPHSLPCFPETAPIERLAANVSDLDLALSWHSHESHPDMVLAEIRKNIFYVCGEWEPTQKQGGQQRKNALILDDEDIFHLLSKSLGDQDIISQLFFGRLTIPPLYGMELEEKAKWLRDIFVPYVGGIGKLDLPTYSYYFIRAEGRLIRIAG